ncbi:MAG TPA: EAL domain-containing protein [Acidimicrobiales bacterium]|nr:EAL domain-containing protein [Acidimicrobiales bacterium]
MIERRFVWSAATALLVLLGSAGSIMGADAVAREQGQKSLQAFNATSAEILSSLTKTIQHEQDLALGAGAFLIDNPNATESQFVQWTNSVRVFAQYPEVVNIGEVTLVPASQLSAFAAREAADPSGPLAADGTFQVTPAGQRPYYCFQTVERSRGAQQNLPAGIDYCDSPLGPALLETRDSGQAAYFPYGKGKKAVLVVGTAIYRGGVVPTTVQARRSALIGWTGTEILPSVFLKASLENHPFIAVTFNYGHGSSQGTFKAGSMPIGAQSTTINLQNGWRVQVFGASTSGGVLSNPNALTLLVGGIILSLLLAILIYVLGTSRSRALQLVHERTDELHHQAFHDSLTGLPNRALILDRASQMLARARRQHTALAVLFLDLDDLKDINDTLGHAAGDQLLLGVGTRLTSALREVDTVGRLGGDEFVVLLEGTSLAAGVQVVADRILDVLVTPFEIPGHAAPLAVTASIGIAEGDRATPEELFQDADIALYRAKATGKRRAVLFSPSMRKAIDDSRNLDVDLHRALRQDELFLLYQPTINLATGTVTGVEALLRWHHPERGVIQPDEFIPLLESSGLIIPVGQWVLEVACRQGAVWQAQGYALTVSVNISAVQLGRDRIVDDVHGALTASGFDPDMLTLELTETTLMNDVQSTLARLELLKAIGVRLAIDDFGTGYSSLAYLQQFPIDVLKIDQSFVSGIADSSDSAAIVHTLVQLGKVLGLETVAEGVENDEQLMRLRAEGVDTGQGFLFARPLDVDAVDQLLRISTGKTEAVRVVN